MKCLLPALLLALASPAYAQDIPLSKILVPNEGWSFFGRFQGGAPANSVKTSAGKVIAIESGKIASLKLDGLKEPTCLALWPDEGHLVIGEANAAWLWAVRIEKDGSFGPGDRYYSLRTTADEKMPVTAIAMDAGGLLYACTPLGIQVFDPTGRLSCVLAAPAADPMTSINIGGPDGNTLFVACGNSVYARRIQGKAIPKRE
jgi:sugar lactone lactonase YvrE